MKPIFAGKKQPPLPKLCKDALGECGEVWAAVAYVTDTKTLIQPCFDEGIPLKLWARHDYSLPVRTDILQQFLDRQSPNFECKLIEGIYHPKIYWWRGYGVYIGSANLTDKAWFQNFEAGLFLSEFELEENNLREELEDYFDLIREYSQPLTQELVDKIKEYEKSREYNDVQNSRYRAGKIELLEKQKSLIASTDQSARRNRRKEKFIKEWNETLEHLRAIASIVSQDEYRPDWVGTEAASGVQADQFLHAYYYNHVRINKGAAHHHEKHEENKGDPETARLKAMKWWKQYVPVTGEYSEDVMIHEWAPHLYEKLSKENLLSLSDADFIAVMNKIHAFRTYGGVNVKNHYLGLSDDESHTALFRRELLAKIIYRNRSSAGQSPLELIYEVLYGGSDLQLPERLFEAAFDPDKKIPHLGISCLGEIVGWARPDVMPPRNNRTSKALYALGYDVKIYSE